MDNIETINIALDLIVNDLDVSGIDENTWDRVFTEICSNCDSRLGCKDCIKKYYINKAKDELEE